MSVHVVADTPERLSALRSMLEQQYAVTSELLSGATIRCTASDAVVAMADLRVVENITLLKEAFGKLSHVSKRIFLIDQNARLLTVQAYALGATRVFVNTVDHARLLAELADAAGSPAEPDAASRGAQEAATAGAASIAPGGA